MAVIIGLTGGIGSGKSTVSCLFKERGIDVVDADKVARLVVEKGSPALAEISEHFGAEIIEDGCLNRSRLRDLIFTNSAEKVWLNDLLHPLIRAEILNQLESATSVYVLLEAPLLIENNLTTYCDYVLVVDVDESLQIARASKRDGVLIENIQAIMNSQVSRTKRLDVADFVIDNSDASMQLLNEAVMDFDSKFKKIAPRRVS